MHQNAARRIKAWASITIDTGDADLCLANRLDVIALVGELSRIVQHQDRTLSHRCPIPRRVKVTAEDLCFTDAVIVQEPVRGLSVGPVLTDQRKRNAITRTR